MSKTTFWFYIVALLIIHTLDMELTRHYVGNSWGNETFLPMQMAIKYVGIHNACWISRGHIYSFLFMMLLKRDSKVWQALLITVTWLYWCSMVGWLFSLEIIKWI